MKEVGPSRMPPSSTKVGHLRAADSGRGHFILASAPEPEHCQRVTYAVNFSKIGPGILAFSFTQVSGRWELRSISLRRRNLGAERYRDGAPDWPGVPGNDGESRNLRRTA